MNDIIPDINGLFVLVSPFLEKIKIYIYSYHYIYTLQYERQCCTGHTVTHLRLMHVHLIEHQHSYCK